MAGRNIGHVEFLVDFDGDDLPRQARRIGNEAGDELGAGLDKGMDEHLSKFGTRLRREMHDAGRDSGLSFTDAFENSINRNLDDTVREVADIFSREKGFDRYADSFDSIGDASDDLDRKLTRLHETGRITDDQFLDMIDSQSEFTRRARRASDEVDRQRTEMSGLNDELRSIDNGHLIRTADAVERQRTAIHGLSEELRHIDNDHLIRTSELMDDVGRSSRAFQIARGEVEEFNRVFAGGDRRHIEEYARSWGTDLPGAFERFGHRMDSVRNEFPSLREEVDRVQGSSRLLRREIDRTDSRFGRFVGGISNFTRRIGPRLENVFAGAARGIGRMNIGLPQVSHNFKQAVFWTGLFIGLAPGIATLGSIAGSGLVALGLGVGALGLAVAALIPGFKGMLGDIDKLPKKARASATALQAFKKPLAEMQDVIQEGLFDGLADDIDALRTKTLPVLTKGMQATAVTLNGIFVDLIGRLTSGEGLNKLDTLLSGLQPVLKSLGGAALNLGGILGSVFNAGLSNGQGFAAFLDEATGKFNAFLNSTEGRDALADWFRNLEILAPRVGGLIGAAGKAVSDLVTDKAVANMATFLDNMTVAIPNVVGSLGGLIDAFDPLGLAAEAVRGIGDWFTKNAPGMAAFGEAANSFAKSVGGTIGSILGSIGEAILKVAPDTLDSLSKGFDALTKALDKPTAKKNIQALADVLPPLGEAVGDLVTALGDAGIIGSALDVIGDAAAIATPTLKALDGVILALSGDLPKAGKAFKNAGDSLDFKKLFGGLNVDKIAGDAVDAVKSGKKGFWDTLLGGFSAPPDDDLLNKTKNQGREQGAKLGGSFGDSAKEGIKSGTDKKAPEIATVFSAFSGTIVQGATDAFNKDTGIGNIFGGFIDKIFGGDTKGEGKAKEKGGAIADALLLGLKSAVEKIPVVGPLIGNAIDAALGGEDKKAKAKGKGKDVGDAFGDGVADGAKDKKKDVESATGDLSSPFSNVPGLISGFLFGVPAAIGRAFGGAAAEGQKGADGTASPFAPVPGRIGTLLNPVLGTIDGLMNSITGQKGADNTSNPFGAVPGKVSGPIGAIPGLVSGFMDAVSGQKGADNAANPFAPVASRVGGYVGGVPGTVNTALAGVNGQPAADRVVSPFSSVPSDVGGKVRGTNGQVSSALAGIDDFGAAGRIVSAFQSVPGLVRSALGGLSGIVSGALGAAKSAISIGIAALPHASGTITTGPEFALIGEAGPEAVVPLNRPLSRVDPAVRDLSAIAQGKMPAGASGAGKVITVESGAIVVQVPTVDPKQAASAMLDRLITKL